MRFFISATLLLPSLALADDQVPLADKVKGWFKAAQDYIPTSVPSAPRPAEYASQKVADNLVHNLTLDNWKDVLRPSEKAAPGESEEWMVYITGGNKTCYGVCGRADAAWKEAVPVLAVQPKGPHLAELDCEKNQILCNSWAVGPPSVYVAFVPHTVPGQPRPPTPMYSVQLNRSSVTALEIGNIHNKQTYKEQGPYEGYFHPFDGLVATTGLALPLAYLMTGMAKLPSWAPMVIISLVTRTFM